jgi:translation initiation factor 5B
MTDKIRSPITVLLGHVDAGKTTLADKIRGTAVAAKMEPGFLTQATGCSFIPMDIIKKICGGLLEKLKVELKIPGLLIIDCPGHAAFMGMRKRGGNISDLAILVVDVTEGFQEQTDESLKILQEYKTPFVVAATKIDKIPGWFPFPNACFSETFQKQRDDVKEDLDKKLYTIISQLSERGFESERFDRVEAFTKQVAIVPVSGITGEGIPELLMVLVGLSQQFLRDRLKVSDVPRGTILEVKETRGFGTTIDVILYDGCLNKGDYLVIGGRQPIATKIKAILLPRPGQELRVEKQFMLVEEVCASTGIKISAPDLENVVAGSPIIAVRKESEVEEAKAIVQKEVEEVEFTKSVDGVIVKADTLGSLEAMIKLLTEEGIPIKKAEVGSVNRQDIIESQDASELRRAVLAFNVKTEEIKSLAKDLGIKLFESNVIYRLMDEYKEWCRQKKEEAFRRRLESLVWPAKIRLIPGCVFRMNKPAVVGVEVLGGKIRSGIKLIRKDGKEVGTIKEVQKEGKTLAGASYGDKVAISMDEPTVGRQIEEGDVLYVYVPQRDVEAWLTEFKGELTENELKILEELKEILAP